MITIVAAVDEDGVIGAGGRLPWHLPADLRRFRELTEGHVVVMGRKTYESIGRPLPRRTNIVLTRNPRYPAPGCLVLTDPADVAPFAARDEVFVIGGREIFDLFLPVADRIHLTVVHGRFPGDTRFPLEALRAFRRTRRERHARDERNPYDYTFEQYDRPAEPYDPPAAGTGR
ncbi:MAG: dihydrofolate reductase [Firmicutes bacterium]|nr:dihydrofolate reductase [Bacillota bacterium]